MSHLARLQLVGRITYSLGWVSFVTGCIVHVEKGILMVVGVSQRNLFELSVVSFLICIASELRVIAGSEKEVAQSSVARQAAA